MIYGYGGGVGWGATCGAVNGGAAFISLVMEQSSIAPLASELFGWYTQVMLPTDTSNQYGIDGAFGVNKLQEALPQHMSGSPLCHASVSGWCAVSDKDVASTERKERCARLTGDTAAYTAQILNDQLDGTFAPLYVVPQTVTDCMACHGGGAMNNVSAKMECEQCHGDPHATTNIEQVDSIALNYELSQNFPNPFNPSTTLQFSMKQGNYVNLHIFDSNGRLVRRLLDGEYMTPGTFRIRWDGLKDGGARAASGVYFARFSAGSFTRSRKMILAK
jgi:hypothetical protein